MRCERCRHVGDPFEGTDWTPVGERPSAYPLLECRGCGHHQHLR